MSLRIIHTADWHLGQTFFDYDRTEEHRLFLEHLSDLLIYNDADVLLVSGDVFDTANPSATAQGLYYNFLREVTSRMPHLQIVIIAGNHDSAARLEAPRALLQKLRIAVVGFVERDAEHVLNLHKHLLPLYDRRGKRAALCLAVPFLRQGDYPLDPEGDNSYPSGVARLYRLLTDLAEKERKKDEPIIAMGHLHLSGADLSIDDRSERTVIGGLDALPSDIFDRRIAYAALGHLHKAQKVDKEGRIRYSGSPLPMSFAERNYRHRLYFIAFERENITELREIELVPPAPLLRIPSSPLPLDSVIEALESLPEAHGDDKLYPYLEVPVALSEPEPSLRHRIEEAVKHKGVRLTPPVPYYPNRQGPQDCSILSFKELRSLDPHDLLRQSFRSRYGEDMPHELSDLLQEVLQDIHFSDSDSL